MILQPILPTAEEEKRIKAGDRELINYYYTANYSLIVCLARGYCRAVKRYDEYLDFAHDVYLHFEELSFEKRNIFVHRVKNCFRLYRVGGARKSEQLRFRKCDPEIYTLDTPFEDSEDRYIDTISSGFDVVEELEPTPSIAQALYDFLASYLAREQKRVFEQFYWTGQTIAEVAITLGKKANTTARTRAECFKKIQAHGDEVKAFLSAWNANEDKSLVAILPRARTFKMSAEQRARAAEKQRRYLARKKEKALQNIQAQV